jgi:CheY-like chemotaxis protein
VACIVVLSHDPAFLETTSAILETADGHDVQLFQSGSNSLQEILACKPEMLILDLADGEFDAWDRRKLRVMQALSTAPVILCTSDGDDADQRAARLERVGPVFTLRKPLQADDMLRTVMLADHAIR